eukprot:356692-Chlamydomonas_euryale.AAC.3
MQWLTAASGGAAVRDDWAHKQLGESRKSTFQMNECSRKWLNAVGTGQCDPCVCEQSSALCHLHAPDRTYFT